MLLSKHVYKHKRDGCNAVKSEFVNTFAFHISQEKKVKIDKNKLNGYPRAPLMLQLLSVL